MAADITAAASADWSAAGTWTPAEPTAADNGLIDGGLNVGVSGVGEAANRVDLGTASGQDGKLTISGGDLTVGSASGADPSVRIAAAGGSSGTLTMTGGALGILGAINGPLSNGDLQIGRDGTGNMNQSGGAVTVGDEIIVGTGPGSVGTLDMSGGTMTNGFLGNPSIPAGGTGRSFILGFGLNSQGNATVRGTAALTVRFDVILGLFDNGIGNLTVQDQGVVNTNFVFAGASPGSTGAINQSGGTINAREGIVVAQRGTITYNHSSGAFNGRFLSVADDGTGIYNLSGNAITTLTGEYLLGVFANGNGTTNQSAGTLTAGGNARVGVDGIGVHNQTGGTFSALNAFLGDFDSSSGTHRVSGGTVTIAGNYSVGGALASNAPPDATRTGTQGQAVGAVGNLIVRGNAATINIGGNLLANPADNTRTDGPDNGATLTFEILNASGTSLINVVGNGDLDGAIIDMALIGFTPTNGAVFNLVTAAQFGSTGTGTTQNTGTGEGYALAAGDAANWTLQVVPGGNGEMLRAIYNVPEPTTLAALSAVATMVLRRRRI